jgi:hypothetical protein
MKFSAVKKMMEQLYERSSVGCCLHITTDDGNLEDHHVQFCIEEAQRTGHPSCERLAREILAMDMPSRAKLLGIQLCAICGKQDCSPKEHAGWHPDDDKPG